MMKPLNEATDKGLSKPDAWRLIRSSFSLLKIHPMLFIIVGATHLFKIFFALLIITPLIHSYQVTGFRNGLVDSLLAVGINLYGLQIYLILALLFFIVYCVITISHCLIYNYLLNALDQNGGTLTKNLKQLQAKFMDIFTFALLNKTWGILARLRTVFIKTIPSEQQPDCDHNWRINQLFTLALILDRNLNIKEALQASKTLSVENFGKKPRYSFLLFKPMLIALLLISLPFLIGLSLPIHFATWIGASISLVAWFILSALSSSLSLIIFIALYELLANKQLLTGFMEVDLRKGLIRAS